MKQLKRRTAENREYRLIFPWYVQFELRDLLVGEEPKIEGDGSTNCWLLHMQRRDDPEASEIDVCSTSALRHKGNPQPNRPTAQAAHVGLGWWLILRLGQGDTSTSPCMIIRFSLRVITCHSTPRD